MRLALCVTIISFITFSNGSFVQSGISTSLYPNILSYETFDNVVFSPSSVPFFTDFGIYGQPCHHRLSNEVILDFRNRIYKFFALVFKKAAVLADGHFVISPHTAWLSLAALAEGTEGSTRSELFKILDLPEDRCLRQIFYGLAKTRENPSHDVILARNRLFIVDPSLRVNPNWEYIARSCNLNTVSVPFKTNPAEIDNLKKIFKAQLPNINLNGNSFLLESLDYNGLWSSAFSSAVIETGPFYNTVGEEIGTIEYMKIKKQVNIAYASSVNLKIIEIPVGVDERYKMLMAVYLGNEEHTKSISILTGSVVFETVANFRPTPAPIEIVIPRLKMTTEIDLRTALDDLGIDGLWTDPTVTRNISSPAATPSSFIQRVTVTIDTAGIRPPIHEFYNIVPAQDEGEAGDSLKSFIANRPFMFGIFDAELYTLLFAATFSKPSA